MKNFNFTKQFITAAILASVGFFGCQKNEMDEVGASLSASNSQDLIANACYTSLDEQVIASVKIGSGKTQTNQDVTIAYLEVGNDDDYLYVQVTVPEDLETKQQGITHVSFKVSGQEQILSQEFIVDDQRRQVLFEIPRASLGEAGNGTVDLTDINISVKPLENLSGSNGDYSATFPNQSHTYQACQVLACAHEKEYWKDANNEWSNFKSFDLGYDEAFLRANLNNNASKNSVKLLQSLTVASLNVANVAANANGVTELKAAIAEAKAALANVDVKAGQELASKIKPGLIGRLHQIPSCE